MYTVYVIFAAQIAANHYRCKLATTALPMKGHECSEGYGARGLRKHCGEELLKQKMFVCTNVCSVGHSYSLSTQCKCVCVYVCACVYMCTTLTFPLSLSPSSPPLQVLTADVVTNSVRSIAMPTLTTARMTTKHLDGKN